MKRLRSRMTGAISMIAMPALLFALLLAPLGPACHAQPQQDGAVVYPTLGNPTSAVATPDGRYVFVSVTNVGASNFTGPDAAAGSREDVVSGVQVFSNQAGKLTPKTFVRVGGAGANGLVLLHGGKTLVIGAGDAGIAFLDVENTIAGNANPAFVEQGVKAGTFDVVASPDGKYVFSANEYGIVDRQRGSVGIVATGIDGRGRFHDPKPIGRIAVGDVVPSLTISPDGSRLYVATELLPASGGVKVFGEDNPVLTRHDCVQKKGTPPQGNGFISVIDVSRAIRLVSPEAILSRVAAGCSPVRLAESTDRSSLYVTARGDNVVLKFDPTRLERSPGEAFRGAIVSGGTAPVGLRLFDHDRWLAVANSDRFAETNGTLALLHVAVASAKPRVLPAGAFPRNIATDSTGDRLYLTNYNSRGLQVVEIRSFIH